jgi:hypothetical protein
VSPDSLRACIGHLSREWGEYGYYIDETRRIGWSGAAAIHVRHFDGSRFWIAADRYGGHLVGANSFAEVVGRLAEEVIKASA